MKHLTPKKLNIYIIKTFIPLLLAGFAVALFVVVIQFLWHSIDTLVGKGVDGLVLLQLLFFASMTMVPLALVLGVLVASLMAFGNLGERMELLAMKAAGIPLVTILKPAFVFVVALALGLFVFQNDWMITSQVKFWQYYFSIKNKSPELAIPEGSFYKGVNNYSIYVERKDKKAKMMYGMMLYDFSEGFDNATILMADSGRLYTTKSGIELILELYNGEAFQNLKQEDQYYTSNSADRPFLRERFTFKELRIPFNNDLSMMDASILSSQFVGKNVWELKAYTDSLQLEIDSISLVNSSISLRQNSYFNTMKLSDSTTEVMTNEPSEDMDYGALSETRPTLAEASQSTSGAYTQEITSPQSPTPTPVKQSSSLPYETSKQEEEMTRIQVTPVKEKLPNMGASEESSIYAGAMSKLEALQNDIYFQREEQSQLVDLKRKNESEYWRKFTYPVACIAFFLIGAPLGALIRKGGMGVPFIVAVFFFIIFYIVEMFGMKMVREGTLVNWFGMWLPNMVLLPVGVMLCLTATRDTNRFNVDKLVGIVKRIFGTSTKRRLEYKEVTMLSSDYAKAQGDINDLQIKAKELEQIGTVGYLRFFLDDEHFAERQLLNEQIEKVVENLSYSRDVILVERVKGYPFMMDLLRTWRTRYRALNMVFAIVFPIGLLSYLNYALRNKKYIAALRGIQETNKLVLAEISRVTKDDNK